jgi:uncharacterized membrane protein
LDELIEDSSISDSGTSPIDSAVKIPKVSTDPIIVRVNDVQEMVKVPIDDEEKKGIFALLSEGIDIGVARLPQLAGHTLFNFGNIIMANEKKKPQRGLEAAKNTFARRIRNAGTSLVLTTQKSVEKRFPDSDEVNFIRDLGTGITSVSASIALGFAFGPTAPGIVFGGVAGTEGVFEAFQKGKPTKEALAIGSFLGIVEGSLEFFGIDRFIKVTGGFLKKVIKRSAIEAIQEFSQTGAEGTIKTSTGLREFKGVETAVEIMSEALYAGSLGAVLGGGSGIVVGSVEQATVKSALTELGASEKKADGISKDLMKNSIHETLSSVEEIVKENEVANEKILDVKKEERVKAAQEKEITLEQVQEKQARQKVQEEKVSKEEIQRIAVEQVKDEQLKGRLKKLDADVRVTDKQIDSLERERQSLKKAGKATLAVENKIDTLLKKRDSLDVQRADILTTAKEQFDLEKETLEIKGETLTKVARQGIKNVIKAKKEGKKLGRQEVENVQLEALKVLQSSELDTADKGAFLKTIKNIKTEAQLEKAIPKIEARIEKLEEKSVRRRLVKDIQKTAKGPIAPDYKAQINSILEIFDLKPRTLATKLRRESRIEFLARERQEGDLDFLPPDFFSNLGITTLDQMTTEQLQEVRDQVTILAHVGSTKQRLLAERGQKDLNEQAQESATSIYDKTNSVPSIVNTERWAPMRGKRGLAAAKDKVDAYFAGHRKVEFISRTLGVQEEVFEKIQSGINKETIASEKTYGKLAKSFQKFEKNFSDMVNIEENIPGVGVALTREQMIGVALNSGNAGNIQRLLKGNEFTQKEIQTINDALTSEERDFVNEIFAILESTFPETVAVTEKLYGVRPPQVEGDYFPIIEDYKTSKQAQLRQASQDLFNNVFQTAYVNRTFTRRRTGGTAPVNITVFEVLLNHIDGVIHYNSLAAEVRDVQKLIKHPTFHQAVSDTMGDNIYNQFPSWLRDVANPQFMRSGDVFSKMVQGLRHNSTASLLAHRVSVSLLQGGSYFQTVNEIGVKYGSIGLRDFHRNRKEATEFAFAKSPDLKNRRTTFDREVREFLKTKQVERLTKGRDSWNEVMFSWISGIDMITTVPTWLGAYQQGLDENNQDEGLAAKHADGVVRRTQPTGSVQNLSAVMRGGQWQKMFTMFMSHFSNMHNQVVSTMNTLKFSKAHPMRKTADFSRSLFWLWVAPAMLGSLIRGGGDPQEWKKFVNELVLYPFGGLLFIRDIMNMLVKGFDLGAPPALSGFVEIGRTFKTKDLQKKLRHGVKAVGVLSGKIPTQYADTLDGAIDLYSGETDDFRRLFMSEWALKPGELFTEKIFSEKKKGKRKTRRR